MSNNITIGSYTLNVQRKSLQRGNKATHLTNKQFELLALLAANLNQQVKRSTILDTVWCSNSSHDARSLNVHMHKLRRLLRADAAISIVNQHGVGYTLTINHEKTGCTTTT